VAGRRRRRHRRRSLNSPEPTLTLGAHTLTWGLTLAAHTLTARGEGLEVWVDAAFGAAAIAKIALEYDAVDEAAARILGVEPAVERIG